MTPTEPTPGTNDGGGYPVSDNETPDASGPSTADQIAEAQAKLDALHNQAHEEAAEAEANKEPDIHDHESRIAELERRVFGLGSPDHRV